MSGLVAIPEVGLRAQALLQAALATAQARTDVLLGGLTLLLMLVGMRVALGIARFVHMYYLRPALNPCSFGPWAVVTGASEGIGRALSNLLAEKGVNIVLVSLPEPRLHEAAAELESKYGVKTRTVPIELCKNEGATTFATIRAALKDIEVGILVNCAGLYQPPAFLEELPDQRILDMLTINSYVPTMLCKMVLPDMRARGRGLVVNIGSATASLMQEAPLLQGYAATKAYLDNLSRSLDAEYAPFGVRVQCIWAAFVATRMTPNLTSGARLSLTLTHFTL
ncbi:beta-ketoacyl reductase [Chlorella sorokiniana]|uniref:Beta-ketoacyl reductase n=1 Tax=Chlorella sorokiniana TaxID=3076 RepID=A0A2P6TDJ7_CHLSO|nr:beta-ketoacyl reductase [Chlorella sorokiniana]|eukprot:PRW20715.1 beta-ketoacyl reductase [Chlorella sorokiniana]